VFTAALQRKCAVGGGGGEGGVVLAPPRRIPPSPVLALHCAVQCPNILSLLIQYKVGQTDKSSASVLVRCTKFSQRHCCRINCPCKKIEPR
jgi:hypothetical protein